MRMKSSHIVCYGVIMCFFNQVHHASLDANFRQKRGSCGGTYTSSHGYVESPNYPSSYPSYSYCNWVITVSARARIRLSFTSFRLEGSDTCQFDYLEIRDGPTSSASQIAKLCGGNIPAPIMSSENSLNLKFRSDGSSEYSGFRGEFEEVFECGGEISQEDIGDIISPHYPRNYDDGVKCLWHIVVPFGSQVLLQFRFFQTELSSGCERDSLEIFDGPDTNTHSLGKYCGPKLINDFRSSGNSMTIRFLTDGQNSFKGFSARFRRVDIPPPPIEVKPPVGTGNRNSAVIIVGATMCLMSVLLI